MPILDSHIESQAGRWPATGALSFTATDWPQLRDIGLPLVSSLPVQDATALGRLAYRSAGGTAAQPAFFPYFTGQNGAWTRFNEPYRTGIAGEYVYEDFLIPDGWLLTGDVNGKARITDPENVPVSDWGPAITTLEMGTAGAQNRIRFLADGVDDTDAVNLRQLNDKAVGINPKGGVVLISDTDTTAGFAVTYSGGATGQTLSSVTGPLTYGDLDSGYDSGSAATAIPTGVKVCLNSEELQNGARGHWNGIYTVSVNGGGGWTLTRDSENDENSEIASSFFFVDNPDASKNGLQYAESGAAFDVTVVGAGAGGGSLKFVQTGRLVQREAGRGMVVEGNALSFCQSTDYPLGALFVADSVASVSPLSLPAASERFLRSDLNNDTPAWSAWALPAAGSAGQVIYFTNNTQTALSTDNASPSGVNGVLVRSTVDGVVWVPTLPASLVPAGTDIIPLSRGGFQQDLGPVGGNFGFAYKVSPTLGAFMDAPPSTGYQFPIVNRTLVGNEVQWLDLFNRANTWTQTQTHQMAAGSTALLIVPPQPGTNGTAANSPYRTQAGRYRTSGGVNGEMGVRELTTANATGFAALMEHRWEATVDGSVLMKVNGSGVFTIGGTTFQFNGGTGSSIQDLAGSTSAFQLPNLGVANATFACLEGTQTFTGQKTWSFASDTSAVRFINTAAGASPRLVIWSGGDLKWGSGAGSPDTRLWYKTAGVMVLGTDEANLQTLKCLHEGEWNGEIIGSNVGGTGRDLTTLTRYSLLYADTGGTDAIEGIPPGPIANSFLKNAVNGLASWSTYSLPAAAGVAQLNGVLYVEADGVVGITVPPPSAILTTDDTGAIDWVTTGDGEDTTTGEVKVARMVGKLVQGTGTNTLPVVHNLGTRNVSVFVRTAVAGDTVEAGGHKEVQVNVRVIDANNIELETAAPYAVGEYLMAIISG